MPLFSRSPDRALPASPEINREPEAARPKRYLVLGSTGHSRGVRSYAWDKLPEDLNVADYDVVVLNFAAFENEDLAGGFPTDRLPSRDTMTRLLFSPDAEIIAIGNPSTLIGPRTETGPGSFYDRRVRADYWLPCFIGVEDDVGTQYRVDAVEWAFYLDHLSGWSWIATGEAVVQYYTVDDYLRPVGIEADAMQVLFEPLATTRYEKLIALRLRLGAVRYSRRAESWSGIAEPDPTSGEVVLTASPVFWLPTPDRVTAEEAIDTIMRVRYGIAEEARVPEWAAAYSLPDEEPIATEIVELERERRELERQISEARGRAVEAARPRLLLYEKGKEILEPIVRQTLRILGAQVEDPEAEGIEDGKVSRSEGQAVVEIKGRNGAIKQDDVRQVVQWATDAKLKDGVEYKPLIVGNPYCDKPLEERGDVVAPNGAAYARNGGVAIVTTVQLFEALRQKQAGVFDEATFWSTVFETSGAAELDEPSAARSSEAGA